MSDPAQGEPLDDGGLHATEYRLGATNWLRRASTELTFAKDAVDDPIQEARIEKALRHTEHVLEEVVVDD